MADSAPLTRLTAALADRYRLERELGAGGMATVYLADDLRHQRRVAVKVLRPELAAVIGADRFLAEIRTTANLQHPHILPLFDSGEAQGFLFYVMPFVEGESLRDRLTREKQLPIGDTIRIATEVASALDYAHRHGVIHRDIKPENILLHDGQALVADFGIALAASRSGGSRMTETGMSLGTPHYMSPEQAMGEREITARSDVYALGCITYEMLTGDPPFTGSTAQAIVAKVVTEKPVPPSRLRDTVPPAVEDAVLTALAKLPADRFASAAAFAAALTAPGGTTRPMPSAARAVPASWIQRHAVPLVAVLGLATLVAGAMALRRPSRPGDAAVNRFTLALESGTGVSNATGGNRFAWAPDGRSFVYVGPGAGGATQLWLRSLDALGPTPVTGTEGASSPFFSPDGRQVGFLLTNPFAIRLVAREGGTSAAVATDSVSGGGVDWGADGWLYFDAGTSIDRIRPDGTGRQMVTPLDTLRHETGIAWPQLLPGNGAVIFRARSLGEDVSEYRIQAVDLGTHRRKELVRATYARYVAPGYLLYVLSDGTLMASRFDVKRLQLTGTPVAIARGLSIVAFGAADLAVSTTGSLLYTVGRGITTAEPVWVGRDGAVTPVDPAWRAVYASGVALSPDGTRLAVSLYATDFGSTSRTEDIWVKQLPAGPLSRLTFEGEQNRRPSWSPDGRDILFLSSRSGPSTLYRQRADGSAPAVRIGGTTQSVPLPIGEGLEAPDGRIILRTELLTGGNGDILVMNQGDTLAKPALASPFQELSPAISPDGHWLAFTSNETGRSEVYVRPFPDVQAGKYQVSTAGGLTPRWSHGGKELFYRSVAEDFMAAEVRTTPAFAVVSQKRLFSSAGFIGTPGHAIFDLAPDDGRFLMLRTGSPNGGPEETVQLILVQNFDAELRRLLH